MGEKYRMKRGSKGDKCQSKDERTTLIRKSDVKVMIPERIKIKNALIFWEGRKFYLIHMKSWDFPSLDTVGSKSILGRCRKVSDFNLLYLRF
jgi:hypothetical protein